MTNALKSYRMKSPKKKKIDHRLYSNCLLMQHIRTSLNYIIGQNNSRDPVRKKWMKAPGRLRKRNTSCNRHVLETGGHDSTLLYYSKPSRYNCESKFYHFYLVINLSLIFFHDTDIKRNCLSRQALMIQRYRTLRYFHLGFISIV